MDRASATLVGFYSESDQGVFTHMGSKTHIHCALDEPLYTGHVDHVTIPAGTTLRFPASGNGRPDNTMRKTGCAAISGVFALVLGFGVNLLVAELWINRTRV